MFADAKISNPVTIVIVILSSLSYMIYEVQDYLFRDSKQVISKLSLNYHLKAYFLFCKQNYQICVHNKYNNNNTIDNDNNSNNNNNNDEQNHLTRRLLH